MRERFTGMQFHANRDNDGSGFAISVRIVPGKLRKSSNSWQNWKFDPHIQSASVPAVTGSGGGGFDPSSNRDGPLMALLGDELKTSLPKVLASPPMEFIQIYLDLTRKD